ncbi:hypothetical protein JW865_09350 [Candidatus Bathyarchaeota archaeon]|nr:hypothetical protein [Candidatus Bathyarchaeota archaeon]
MSNFKPNGYHVQKEFWKIVEDEKENLKDEITWIKHTWWYLRHGYWFMNYGKATWLPPWYFRFLNFYYIEEKNTGYPQYRDRDRRAEIGAWYAYTATESFKNLDKEGNALNTEMIDFERRVFYGTIEPKRRRGGATARSLNHGLYIMETNIGAYCEITADIGKHSKDIFREKLSPAWSHTPIFLKPVYDGDDRPAKSINLSHPKTVLKENCLSSVFGYTESADEKANDSRSLYFLLSDEEGKGASRADVKTRWGINMLTMSQMQTIYGYCDHPSTVEEMKDGGAEYRSMFEFSDFYIRNTSGQTLSGLLPLFFKATDGADGFIDRWGYSVIDDPTEDQIKYAPKGNTYAKSGRGSLNYLKTDLEILLNDGSFEKLKEYREKLRRNPLDSADCWRGAAGDMGFNIIIIDKAIIDAKYKKVYQGNFVWERGIRDSKVVWKDDKVKGKWFVSDFLIGRDNKWKYAMSNHQDPETGRYVQSKTPLNPLITMGGCDSFRFRAASQTRSLSYGENSSLSDGGLAVLLNFDSSIDGDNDEKDWSTERFICTYRNRPSLDDYCEDALMMCVYYGCMIIGERNTEYMIDYFIKRGYAGYLLYLMDATGKVAPQPWVYSGGVNSAPKTDALSFFKEHIDLHGHKEFHTDLLLEAKNLSSPEDLHTKDLLAAALWAKYGAKKGHQRKYDRIELSRTIDITNSWLRGRNI